MVVLDTDHLSVLEWETDTPAGKLLTRLSQLDPDEAVTTIVNFEEQIRGWLAFFPRQRTYRVRVLPSGWRLQIFQPG